MKKKFEYNKTNNKIIKVFCSRCENNTKHKVLTSINEEGSEIFKSEFSLYWITDFEIVKCLGCESLSFRTCSINSETEDELWDPIPTISVYPKRGSEILQIKSYLNIPVNLKRIYKETIDSFNNDNLTLCGAGVRALVEGLCKENHITGGIVENQNNGKYSEKRKTNLQGKINGLAEEGKLTEKSAELLHEHRYLGNTAIHDLSIPSKEDLSLAIEILENVLDSLYEMPDKGSQLKRRRLRN